jgi:hypothetical protein
VDGVPAAAHESIKGRPIGLAKLLERGAGEFRFGLAPSGRQDHAPMGRSERLALAVNGSRQKLHSTRLAKLGERGKPKKMTIPCSTLLGIRL